MGKEKSCKTSGPLELIPGLSE